MAKQIPEMKVEDVVYLGIKVSNPDLAEVLAVNSNLSVVPLEHTHITLVFKPNVDTIKEADLGETSKLTAVGIGCYMVNNEVKNIGIKVAGYECDQYHVAVPHITVWVAKDGRAVDTAKASFKEIDGPYIYGRVAVFDRYNNWSYKLAD